MTPRILEFEDNRVKVTAQAYAIPEIKAILDKYTNAEPYLSYIHAMTALDSPYCNIPLEEKSDAILYDVKETIGEFDEDDPILEEAIEKLRGLYLTPNMALALELGEELHRFRRWLRDNAISEDNMGYRQSIMKDIDKYSANYIKVKTEAEKELKVATKGDHEIGGY